MTSQHDPIRFLHFVRRSGDLAFARHIAKLLRGDPHLRDRIDRELRSLPRDPGATSRGAARVLGSVVERLGLGTA